MLLFYLSFVLLALATTHSKNLPSYIKKCERYDPKVNICLQNMVETLRPKMAHGIPEMRIPPLDPLVLSQISLEQGSGSVRFNANFNKLLIFNATKFSLTQMDVIFEEPANIHFVLKFPHLRMVGDYDISGKVLVLPIKGSGKIDANLTDVTGDILIHGKYVTKNGKEYIKLGKSKIKITMKGIKVLLTNLFNGNKQLGDSMNKFINENWKDIVEEIMPLVEDTVSRIMTEIVSNILELYSMEELFIYPKKLR